MRGALLAAATVLLLSLVAGCGGGGEQRLADGSAPPALPGPLAGLANAVMTRMRTVPASEIAPGRRRACGLFPPSTDEGLTVVQRVGHDGSSLTFATGSSLNACDAIAKPLSEPDRPFAGIWCGASVGRLEDGRLNDPRLDLCTAEDHALTAFVWVEPQPGARWVVVTDAGKREVYEVAESLPVRVTTTDSVRPEGSAAFDVEEHAANGRMLRAYTLEAATAG